MDKYYGFLVHDADPIELDENNENPITYMDAMQRFDSELWLNAMRSKMESMKINSIWTLIDLPKGIKLIGCKWIFKRKRGIDKKLETYKAYLATKWYHQRYSIDYDKIFFPMTMLKSIRIILAIVAYMDYKIWKIDVKITFLNGELEKEVYMIQPEDFTSTDESKVCKL